MALAVVGCAPTKPHRAPVEDRGSQPVTAPPPAQRAPEPKAVAPESGRVGFYTVKSGDTLIRIALDHGQSWRDVARWNGMDNPNLIEVGQVLRVVPPGPVDGAATRPIVANAPAETRTLEPAKTESKPATVASSPAGQSSAPASAAVVAAPEGELNWAWPASGAVTAPFDEARNVKGLAISGKAGDPVLAAADGRVMYAGSGLRGYGNMVILKHNDTFLSAYAHNQALLVKEDQVVKRGQHIADMGSTDTDSVKLHFEIRRKGKPVDPARLLPAR
jgi:lipoprotein NlpD